jgi:hypothetical protein
LIQNRESRRERGRQNEGNERAPLGDDVNSGRKRKKERRKKSPLTQYSQLK